MTWFDCVKEPSETGKKVLCVKNGDLYVAIRLGKYYIPMPFADHHFCIDLCAPEKWCAIDFPDNLTGHTRILHPDSEKLITLSECEIDYPEIFHELAQGLINKMGKSSHPYFKTKSES